ncbi:MAG: DUF1802 family protein [Chloroflexi bacterium]|nr:DUF1802 family protein [Chloroflexota bacterium]
MVAVACPWSLKEWAVTLRALDQGKQILLLRKGGIREKEFKVEHEEFFLYPSYEHQRQDLLKAAYHRDLEDVLAGWDGNTEQVPLTHWCQVTEVFEITDPADVEALSPFYIWTTDYAEQRLHWRPRKPLEILLVRVHRLPEPYLQRVEPYFAGCKSWIDLPAPVSVAGAVPVLSAAEFQRQAEAIRTVLRRSSSLSR